MNDQPPPIPQPDRRPTWDLVIDDYRELAMLEWRSDPASPRYEIDRLVIADMAARSELGRIRYGTPLTAGNGRNHLIDAYQEALDLAVYLRNWLEERVIVEDWHEASIRQIYKATLRSLETLRRILRDEMRRLPPTVQEF